MKDHMNLDEEVTRRVDGIGTVAGALMEQMKTLAQANDTLTWTDMISAAAVACRGVAAMAMVADPELTLDQARMKMTRRFVEVMSLPPELVRVQKAEDGEEAQVIVVPVRKNS
jgi:hypothetical protein